VFGPQPLSGSTFFVMCVYLLEPSHYNLGRQQASLAALLYRTSSRFFINVGGFVERSWQALRSLVAPCSARSGEVARRAESPWSDDVLPTSLLEEWEAEITDVDEESFFADLIDPAGRTPDEYAEFPVSQVAIAHRNKIQVGARFRWSLYARELDSSRETISRIEFHGEPTLTDEMLSRAASRDEVLARLLKSA